MPSPLGFLIKTTGIYATADSSALGDPIKADDVNQKFRQTRVRRCVTLMQLLRSSNPTVCDINSRETKIMNSPDV